jgi:hypothetical protein
MAISNAARRRSLRAAVLATVLAAAPAAQAHVRSGVVAVGERATVGQAPAGVSVRIDRSDLAVRLTVAPGDAVLVRGYAGEQFLRVDGRGVFANAASPTAAVTGVTKRGSGWQRLSDGRTATWHDARVRALRSGIDRRGWVIPLAVDGRATRLTGVTERVRAPPWWPWLLVGAAFAVLVVRPDALGAVAGAVTLATALIFALDRYASAGTLVESANEVFLALVGLGVLAFVREPPAARYGAVAGLGTIALFIGLTKFTALSHGVVLAVLPATLTRVLVVAALASGALALGLAARFFIGFVPDSP